MRSIVILPVLASALVASLAFGPDALACGACIVPPGENTIVTAHRMALSISPKQTTLWDQIEYNGNPAEFAWVLPVKPGAVIEVSSDAWFEALDAATSTQVFQPNVDCGNGSSSGFGCGMADESARGVALGDSAGGTGGFGTSVTVVHRGTVGPYTTVTLSTDKPGVLNDWLTSAGYALDPATQPVVDAYVAEGFDFIALRLQPGKDVQSMKPVRVVQPGASPVLPLRMVAIGTGANVAISLFVISEGRFEAKNFANVLLPSELLSWDFQTSASNYAELRKGLLAQNGGKSWLSSFAFQGAILSPLEANLFMGGTRNYASAGSQNFVDTIAGAYVQQGITNGESASGECSGVFPTIASSKAKLINPCPAGVALDDPSCDVVGGTDLDARMLACGELTDLVAALDGMHPSDVWLTRLEADLPRAALAEDLVVQPSAEQKSLDNMKRAALGTNVEAFCGANAAPPPAFGLPEGKGGGGASRRGPLVVAFGMGLLGLAAVARKRLGRFAKA